jgi:hypothetical protein
MNVNGHTVLEPLEAVSIRMIFALKVVFTLITELLNC